MFEESHDHDFDDQDDADSDAQDDVYDGARGKFDLIAPEAWDHL